MLYLAFFNLWFLIAWKDATIWIHLIRTWTYFLFFAIFVSWIIAKLVAYYIFKRLIVVFSRAWNLSIWQFLEQLSLLVWYRIFLFFVLALNIINLLILTRTWNFLIWYLHMLRMERYCLCWLNIFRIIISWAWR